MSAVNTILAFYQEPVSAARYIVLVVVVVVVVVPFYMRCYFNRFSLFCIVCNY